MKFKLVNERLELLDPAYEITEKTTGLPSSPHDFYIVDTALERANATMIGITNGTTMTRFNNINPTDTTANNWHFLMGTS